MPLPSECGGAHCGATNAATRAGVAPSDSVTATAASAKPTTWKIEGEMMQKTWGTVLRTLQPSATNNNNDKTNGSQVCYKSPRLHGGSDSLRLDTVKPAADYHSLEGSRRGAAAFARPPTDLLGTPRGLDGHLSARPSMA